MTYLCAVIALPGLDPGIDRAIWYHRPWILDCPVKPGNDTGKVRAEHLRNNEVRNPGHVLEQTNKSDAAVANRTYDFSHGKRAMAIR